MDVAVVMLAQHFETSGNLFIKALRGISRDELLTRPGAQSNSMLWVAGHLTQFRHRITNILGAELEIPWGELFATGARVGDPGQYPSGDQILARWSEVTPELLRRLRAADPQSLAAPPPARVASTDNTLRGALVLFAFHEGYHVGQMGFLRKWVGHPPLFD